MGTKRHLLDDSKYVVKENTYVNGEEEEEGEDVLLEEQDTDVFHSILEEEEEEKKEEKKSAWRTLRNRISEIIPTESDVVEENDTNVGFSNVVQAEMKKKMNRYIVKQYLYYKNLTIVSLLTQMDSISGMIHSSITNNMLLHVE